MENIKSYSFDSVVKYYENFSNNGLFNYEKNIISKYFSKFSRILDIGCGTGRTTISLHKMGYDIVGVDYSSKMIEVAKKLAPSIEYKVQDVRNLTFNSERFDYALFSFNGLMLLETYEDRKKAVLEISRILKNDGLFFFTTPFIDNKLDKKYWKEKLNTFNKPLEKLPDEEKILLGDDVVNEDDADFHLHIPFLKEISKLMEVCSFEIIYSHRRLEVFPEELQENELDDNYLWVVRKKNV